MNINLARAQFFILIFTLLTGFIYLSIQTSIISHGKRASWLIFIVVSMLAFLIFVLYEKNYQYFVLGKVTSFIYLFYWLIHLSIFVSYTIHLISTWMSPNTPLYALLIVMLLPSLYASLSRPETAVNIGVIFSVFIIFFILFVLFSAKDFHIENLLPIGESGRNDWLWGTAYSFTAYRNMECYLILRKYVMKNQKIDGWPLFIFFLVLFGMYLFSIITVMMFFNLDEFKLISEPILYLLHSQEVTFVKRLDLIFVFVWVLISTLTLINYILVARLVRFHKKLRHQKLQVIVYHLLIYIGAYSLHNFQIIQTIRNYSWVAFFIFGFFLPLLIICWNKLRGRTIFDSSSSSS